MGGYLDAYPQDPTYTKKFLFAPLVEENLVSF
jgi:hypothetical protein